MIQKRERAEQALVSSSIPASAQLLSLTCHGDDWLIPGMVNWSKAFHPSYFWSWITTATEEQTRICTKVEKSDALSDLWVSTSRSCSKGLSVTCEWRAWSQRELYSEKRGSDWPRATQHSHRQGKRLMPSRIYGALALQKPLRWTEGSHRRADVPAHGETQTIGMDCVGRLGSSGAHLMI